MFKNENIHPAVQKALYRKIDSLNRLRLGTDSPFFNGGVLEPRDDSNPVEQHLFRNCFAKVSAAIKSETQDELLDLPESLSSYFTIGENRTSQTNKPLTFRKSFEETPDNIFRGHTGITSIEASQLSFFTKKYTINFSCPDPIDFEERVQPTFLRHGQFVAIEFGWGIEEDSVNIPPLSNKDLQDLVDGVRERNLKAAGNYLCDVGIVTNYNFELNSTGGYTGTIDVVTQGQNILNQTTQEADSNTGEVMSEIIKNLEKAADKQLTEEEATITGAPVLVGGVGGEKEIKTDELKRKEFAQEEIEELQIKSTTYQSAMRNLDKVLDEYLGEKKVVQLAKKDITRREGSGTNRTYTVKKGTKIGGNDFYTRRKINKETYFRRFNETEVFNEDIVGDPGTIEYLFKNGAMYLNIVRNGYLERPNPSPPNSLKKRYFISWGWFEDFILNTFFRTKAKGKIIQQVRSIDGDIPTDCNSSKHLFSMGLDSVILPNKHQPKINQEFKNVKQYNDFSQSEKVKLARIRDAFGIIDENFDSFQIKDAEKKKDDSETDETLVLEKSRVGVIRNMVFPIEMIQRHFTNISTVRQGMQSFWAEVSNLYGGYWNFQILEDDDVPGKIGVVDFLSKTKEEDDPNVLANRSDRTTFKDYKFTPDKVSKQYQKMFTFPLYSKDGIVKEFSLDIKLTSKAATLVNYGTNTNILNSVGSGDSKDLGLIAYSYLFKKNREEALKIDTDKSAPINKPDAVLENLSYEINKNDGVGLGTDDKEYKGNVRKLDEKFGIDFRVIKDIQDDQDELLQRIQSGKALLQDGIGMYDENGNLAPMMKKYMNYIINYSLHEGDESNLQRTRPIIPIELSMTLDGIGGLKPGDMFRVDYLPKVYRDFAYFQIFQINHSMGTSGWETKITAKMKVDLTKMREEGYIQKAPPRNVGLDTLSNAMRDFVNYKDTRALIKKAPTAPTGSGYGDVVDDIIEGSKYPWLDYQSF